MTGAVHYDVPFCPLVLWRSEKTSELLDAHFLVRMDHVDAKTSGLRVSPVTSMKRMSLLSFLEGAKVHEALPLVPLTITVQTIEHIATKKAREEE